MCGRYTDPSSYDAAIEEFSITHIVPDLSQLGRRFNIAPQTETLAVFDHGGERTLGLFNWTFIPPWSRDGKPGKFSTINARDDKIIDSRLYGPSFKSKRCLIPAGGFYEWRGNRKPKQPYYIHRVDGRPLALAGVWSEWHSRETDDERYSFAIITTSPNDVMSPIHDRMPVILGRKNYDAWLDPLNTDVKALRELLRPCPDEWLVAYLVSTYVNAVGNEGPQCIERLSG